MGKPVITIDGSRTGAFRCDECGDGTKVLWSGVCPECYEGMYGKALAPRPCATCGNVCQVDEPCHRAACVATRARTMSRLWKRLAKRYRTSHRVSVVGDRLEALHERIKAECDARAQAAEAERDALRGEVARLRALANNRQNST